MSAIANVDSRTRYAAAIRVMVAAFPYWCMSVLRAVSPYLVIALIVLQGSTAFAAPSSPESFVQQNVEQGFAILNDKSLAPSEREAQFRALLLSITDVKRVALFTLGPYARGVSDSQEESFVNAFASYFVVVLEQNLERYPGQTVTVTGSKIRAADDVIVTAKLSGGAAATSRAAPVNIAFRIRTNASGADSVVDLQVEGVSMALTQRDEFSAFLAQHAGNIGLLTAELEARAARVHTGNSIAQSQVR